MNSITPFMPGLISESLPCSNILGTLLPFPSPKNSVLSTKMNTQSIIPDTIVESEEEYDRFVEVGMPILLGRASNYTKKILKETNSWTENVSHEKLALRLSYELVERFLVYARNEVPCRPTLLLDSFVAKHFSQPTSFVHNYKPLTPLDSFIDGLSSKAVVSRDALIAQLNHYYNLTPSQVIRLLGLAEEQSQRIYKNFTRWRQSGWQRTMKEIGFSLAQITGLEEELEDDPHMMNRQALESLIQIQAHYRKSEPDHYPCQTPKQWGEMFTEGHGQDYRIWHLSMCHPCLSMVYASSMEGPQSGDQPLELELQLQVQPGSLIPRMFQETTGVQKHGS
jgi:hypothetical protein